MDTTKTSQMLGGGGDSIGEAHPISIPENQEYCPPLGLEASLCLLSDGMLHVSMGAKTQPEIVSYIARVRRLFRQSGREIQVIDSDIQTIGQLYKLGQRGAKRIDSSTTQRICNQLILDAVKAGSSDIHIRIERNRTRVFFRVLGDLVEQRQHEQTLEIGQFLIRTLYVSMSDESDATYKERERQDAVINDPSKLPAGLFGVRIVRAPTNVGEIMVLRILYDTSSSQGTLGALGYADNQLSSIEAMMAKPTGINFISGPTGSGKSTTLQRALAQVFGETMGRKNIVTVEDPTEYVITGAVQTSVTNASTDEERARQFVGAIRAAMRMDPDIIMISEVRDFASARAALQASMTGHQVYTTIHANSAMHIFDRLLDLGMDLSLLTDETLVTGLVAQRLVKQLCPHCKLPLQEALSKSQAISRRQMDRIFKTVKLGGGVEGVCLKGDGCDKCRGSGYTGRTVVAEVIAPDGIFMDYMRSRDKRAAERHWRTKLGGVSMMGHAIDKISAGLIDPRDVESQLGFLTDELNRLDFLKAS
ncbi:MAG: hypothetical protein RIR70_2133 [Pseudomonadota bacterium]|jgi:type II secretory ATPase GspE/PulE/Tfp pilus assembly ATPase PilB-like protein